VFDFWTYRRTGPGRDVKNVDDDSYPYHPSSLIEVSDLARGDDHAYPSSYLPFLPSFVLFYLPSILPFLSVLLLLPFPSVSFGLLDRSSLLRLLLILVS
jgi:hypothetical protein